MTYYAITHRPDKQRYITPGRTAAVLLMSFIMIAASLTHALAADGGQTTASTPLPRLLITAVQTGGCVTEMANCTEDSSREFIEMYNTRDADVSLTGVTLRYLSSSGNTPTVLIALDGTLKAHSYLLAGHERHEIDADIIFGKQNDGGLLAKSGGHVELTDIDGTAIDRVGWGSAAKPLGKAAVAAGTGQTLVRNADQDGRLLHSGNNSTDFVRLTAYQPQHGGYLPATKPADTTPVTPLPSQSSGTNNVPDSPAASSTCRGILISELLPNPAGTDTGREFIELYNPTDRPISLGGCVLKTSASTSKLFKLDGKSVAGGQYIALSDTETGLTLPNSNGGTVWLLDSTDELQSISYPAAMEDDRAWALGESDGGWFATYTPTPSSANLITVLRPCDDPSQVRSAETGRCSTPATEASSAAAAASTSASQAATACKPGQERNPATNRCRAIASTTATAVAACKAGQVRNPETNRCKAASSTATGSACAAGQERNPETNRCRKIASSAGTATKITDQDSSSASGGANRFPTWLIASVIITAIVGYGVYEWRQEIQRVFRNMTAKMRVRRQSAREFSLARSN